MDSFTSHTSFTGLRSGSLSIHLIESSNAERLAGLLQGQDDSEYMLHELRRSYLPRFDDAGQRTKFGFRVERDSLTVGLCLLGVSSWEHRRGYTGADTIRSFRGQGIAPGCKPMLFYLAFEMLHLHRVETGCLRSNESSRRSIEKTKGFEFEGVLRDYNRTASGEFEDDLRWSILEDDYRRLYDRTAIEVVRSEDPHI